jgi:hypothetical protein
VTRSEIPPASGARLLLLRDASIRALARVHRIRQPTSAELLRIESADLDVAWNRLLQTMADRASAAPDSAQPAAHKLRLIARSAVAWLGKVWRGLWGRR